MDKTETYIKMCERATEIRVMWRPDGGDFYFDSISYERRGKVSGLNVKNFIGIRMRYCSSIGQVYKGQVWLPRQDQLQELVIESCLTSQIVTKPRQIIAMIYKLIEFMEKYGVIQSSCEQLWLAFVMKEKYGKVWDGNDWNSTTNS